jgi:hypothetical protein
VFLVTAINAKTNVVSAVGTFIALTTLFLLVSSVYLAWRVYVKGKSKSEKYTAKNIAVSEQDLVAK